MKRLISVLTAVVLLSILGLGQTMPESSAVFTTVSSNKPHATRHRAHKAAKHRKPKHHRTA